MKRLTLRTTLWLSALTFPFPSIVHAAPPKTASKPTSTALPPSSTLNGQSPTLNTVSPVWSVAFSPDGKRIAVGAYQCVRVYEIATGKKVAEWKTGGDAIRSVAFSADGKTLAAGGGVPGQSGTAWVLDAQTGKTLRIIKSHEDAVEAVAWAGNTLLTAGDDEKVGVDDAATGRAIGKLSEHNGRCLSVVVPSKTSDEAGGDIWATGGADNMLKIWDAKARRVVVNFDQCASPVWSLAVQPQNPGHFIAGCGDGLIRYFAVRLDKDGKPDEQGVAPRTGYLENGVAAHDGPIFALASAPNQAFVVTGGADSKVGLWNMGGGQRKQFRDATAPISGVAVSPDSKYFACASLDGKCRLYDAEKGTLLVTLGAMGPEAPAPLDPKLDPRLAALLPKKLASGTGLTGRYYDGREIGGKPGLTRLDRVIDFSFPRADQGPGIESSEFSARWDGFLEAPKDGQYRLFTSTDDGVRLWVNGKSEIDAWRDQGETEYATAPLTLKAGQRIPIRMEFYQGVGGAAARLRWEYPGQDKQIIPTTYLYPVPATKGK